MNNENSVVMMLGRPEKLDAYAWLLDKEAELRETRASSMGRPAASRRTIVDGCDLGALGGGR
jgi:hypothetical protein